MKKMKFERKQAREQRKEPMEAPMPVESKLDEPTPAKPKVERSPMEQIAAYVKSMDWGRVRATANKAIQSGVMSDEQVDGIIDAALPSVEQVQAMPLHHVMAVASAATPEKRAEYMPILAMHAEHAKNLPPEEQGQVKDHMQLLGVLNPA